MDHALSFDSTNTTKFTTQAHGSLVTISSETGFQFTPLYVYFSNNFEVILSFPLRLKQPPSIIAPQKQCDLNERKEIWNSPLRFLLFGTAFEHLEKVFSYNGLNHTSFVQTHRRPCTMVFKSYFEVGRVLSLKIAQLRCRALDEVKRLQLQVEDGNGLVIRNW